MLKRRKLIALLIGLVIAGYLLFLEFIAIIMKAEFNFIINIIIFLLYIDLGFLAGGSLYHMIMCIDGEIKNFYTSLKKNYKMQYCLCAFVRDILIPNIIAIGMILISRIINNVNYLNGVMVALTVIGTVEILIIVKIHKKAVKCWEKYIGGKSES